jgi:threonine dehydratase
VHPVRDAGVMAGNGTIGLEILEDLPDPDAVVIPHRGGGLTAGIASAIKALRPQTRIVTAEPETAARCPLRWTPGIRSRWTTAPRSSMAVFHPGGSPAAKQERSP